MADKSDVHVLIAYATLQLYFQPMDQALIEKVKAMRLELLTSIPPLANDFDKGVNPVLKQLVALEVNGTKTCINPYLKSCKAVLTGTTLLKRAKQLLHSLDEATLERLDELMLEAQALYDLAVLNWERWPVPDRNNLVIAITLVALAVGSDHAAGMAYFCQHYATMHSATQKPYRTLVQPLLEQDSPRRLSTVVSPYLPAFLCHYAVKAEENWPIVWKWWRATLWHKEDNSLRGKVEEQDTGDEADMVKGYTVEEPLPPDGQPIEDPSDMLQDVYIHLAFMCGKLLQKKRSQKQNSKCVKECEELLQKTQRWLAIAENPDNYEFPAWDPPILEELENVRQLVGATAPMQLDDAALPIYCWFCHYYCLDMFTSHAC